MGKQHTNDEILVALARARYFDAPSSMQDVFRAVVEDHLSIGLERAIRQLSQSGLAEFRYSSDVGLHPFDQVDTWEIPLTEAGRDALKRLGFQ